MTAPITTHVLDTAIGRPAAGVRATLERAVSSGDFAKIGEGVTDVDGRIKSLLAPGALVPGDYRLTFAVGAYFAAQQRPAFFARIPIEFTIDAAAAAQHYHVPLLLSPFGYTTYRGS